MDERDKRSETDRRIALDARDWIVRLTSGHASEADLQRFRAWRDDAPEHRRAFERERLFWRQLQALDGTLDVVPPHRVARQPAIGRRAFLIGGGAAAAAAVAAITVTGRPRPRLRRAGAGGKRRGRGRQRERYAANGRPGGVTPVDTDAELAWRTGRVIFEGRPFAGAVASSAARCPSGSSWPPAST
ncbi:DUF4880 domain-containing protein [Thauera sp. SDU_THAU2]|uniref:DUF4880 domain-containing protein n=1 Tax=Thauera sp. SDU_THAU2 TaxID=3136633 RepID=UPI00311FDAB6